jgi:D-xylose transport system permease protein
MTQQPADDAPARSSDSSTSSAGVQTASRNEAELQEPAAGSLAAAASTVPTGNSVSDYAKNYVQRLRGGEMGSLPAASGLVLLYVLFSILQPTFGGLYNLGNMLTEGAGPIFIAMGLVFVLLLGEIDLSAGFAAGVCACVMVRLMVGYHAPWPVSIGAAIITGVIIGLLIGVLRAKVRIPSFVVTLAFFLAFQGVALYIAENGKGQKGDIAITSGVVNGFDGNQMPLWAGWLLGVIIVAGYAAVKLSAQAGRRRQGLHIEPVAVIGFKLAAVAVGTLLLVFLLNQNRAVNKAAVPKNVNGKLVLVAAQHLEGIPWVVPVIIAFFVVWTFMLSRTRYGRHVYAVGGNEEAARRAGIPVDRIRISVFVLCSGMSAIGGIMIGSNVQSVSVGNYGGNTLLLAVGAAVIGGTSLFGGKGRIIDAIIGGAVVEVIYNGMSDLVTGQNSSAVQYVVTGLVLMLAAAVDALSRRRAGSTGL